MLGWICVTALAAIWALYPGAMGLLARYREQAREPEGDAAPSVSVILATRGTQQQIGDRIRNLLATHYPADRIEIVVGLDIDAVATELEIQALGPAVKVAHAQVPGGKALALNAAVSVATGDVLVFTDTHQSFDGHTIPALVRRIQHKGIGAVSGALTLGGEQGAGSLLTLYWRVERWLRAQEARVHSTVGVSGSVYAMRRPLWRELPPGLILDDLYIPMSVVLQGLRVDFAPEAQASDGRDTTPDYEFQRKVRTLTGNFQLCAVLPEVLSPARNPIWPQFVLHKLLRLLSPYLLIGAAIGLSGATLELVESQEWQMLAGAALLCAMLWIPLPWIRRVRDSLRWALVLQVAIVVATVNALRGEWNVWTRR